MVTSARRVQNTAVRSCSKYRFTEFARYTPLFTTGVSAQHMLSSETRADWALFKGVVDLHKAMKDVVFRSTDFWQPDDLLQAALTVTLRSKNAFSVKLRPLNISVRNKVWELSSITEAKNAKCQAFGLVLLPMKRAILQSLTAC